MAGVSQVYSLLVNLKHKSGNWCVGKEGENHSKVIYPGYPRLSNEELFKGESSQVPYLVVELAAVPDSCQFVIQMDVLAIKSLMSDSCMAHGEAQGRIVRLEANTYIVVLS